MSKVFASCFLILAWLTGFHSHVIGQDVLEQVYGMGVHAFYAGHTEKAREYFNDAINAGSEDPRLYYFKGLNEIQSQGGMSEAGIPDFEHAAQLEVAGKIAVNVPKALSRIQGPTRMVIENIRLKARLAARATQTEEARRKYGDGSPSPDIRIVPPATDGQPPTGGNNPFDQGADLTEGQPSPMPMPNDTPATEPTPADPFAPSPSPSNDPDPFAPSPSPSPSAPADPFGAPPEPSNAANPFGDDASPAPAAGNENPFGI